MWALESGCVASFFPSVMASQPARHRGCSDRLTVLQACVWHDRTWVPGCVCAVCTHGMLFLHALSSRGSGPFPEPRWAHATWGRRVGTLQAAGPGDKIEFPWRKLLKREAAALEREFFSIRGALLAGKWDTVAEPSWKICCNHYLCSLFIMHLNETQMHPTHCVNTDLLKLKCYWRCFQFSDTLALC